MKEYAATYPPANQTSPEIEARIHVQFGTYMTAVMPESLNGRMYRKCSFAECCGCRS